MGQLKEITRRKIEKDQAVKNMEMKEKMKRELLGEGKEGQQENNVDEQAV